MIPPILIQFHRVHSLLFFLNVCNSFFQAVRNLATIVFNILTHLINHPVKQISYVCLHTFHIMEALSSSYLDSSTSRLCESAFRSLLWSVISYKAISARIPYLPCSGSDNPHEVPFCGGVLSPGHRHPSYPSYALTPC